MTYRPQKKLTAESANKAIFFNFFAAAALLAIIVLYFVQTNKIIENNYKLMSSQALLKDRQEQNQNLQTSALQFNSLKNLGERAKGMSLVSVDKVTYLKPSPEFFAFANNR